MEKQRNMMVDNLRGVLILLVVLGHLLERIAFPGSVALYCCIYSFHMPGFAFVSGLVYNPGSKGLWKRTLVPYLVFQVVGLWVQAWEQGEALWLQFSTPNWTLWYLVALLLWNLAARAMDLRGRRIWFYLAASLGLGILVGFDSSIGYPFSVSRTVCLFPFFLAGAGVRTNGLGNFEELCSLRAKPLVSMGLILPAVAAQGILLSLRNHYPSYILYWASSYRKDYTALTRLLIYVAAAVTLVALCRVIPKGKVPMLTYIGQNTMPIYLLHGPVIRVMTKLGLLGKLPGPGAVRTLILVVGLTALFASPPVVWAFRKVFGLKWMSLETLERFQTERKP